MISAFHDAAQNDTLNSAQMETNMDAETALLMIQPLADGVDPISGEEFDHDSPYQHPQIVRALNVAIAALEQDRLRNRRKERLPNNAGLPWTPVDDETLIEAFATGTTVKEMATSQQRTVTAIKARLEKLGKLPG